MYNYAAFSKEKNNSIGCGVISKYEINKLSVHALDVRCESDSLPPLRPIMEVELNVSGKNISMFINHWKSKSGGQLQSEKWRLWQENILGRELNNSRTDILFAAGDFNKDISDFVRDKNNNCCFNFIDDLSVKNKKMYSPWNERFNNYGSYYFRGEWEKIDHFFACNQELIKDFEIITAGDITKPDGTPNKYEMYNHQGYSDHLPIRCVISMEKM